MKNMKSNGGLLVMSLCEIVIGILLFLNPVSFTSFVIIVLGIVLVFSALRRIVRYFRTDPAIAAAEHDLTIGFICMAVGIFCIARSGWLIAIIPLLAVFYGIIMLLTGIMKVQCVVDAIRLRKKKWGITLASAILSIVAAVVIILNPFTSTVVLWSFAGVSLIVAAVFDIVFAFLGKEA